jgi:hypothetical protein
MLDKFALYPLSYRVIKEINKNANALKLYDKMQKEDIDYVVFKSARKVGAEEVNPVYDANTGEFNTEEYKGIIKVPFSIMSVQSEVPSKEESQVTRGSQVTKLITMDFMEAGIPIDFKDSKGSTEFSADRYKEWYTLANDEARKKASPLFEEIKKNQELLEKITEHGYQTLLNKLGIKEIVDKDGKRSFKIIDLSKAAETLREEILKREVNDNIIKALDGFINGDVVLEATPAYQQIKNILYSIADKNVVSSTINGDQKVQISPALLESIKGKEVEINGKKGFVSKTLAFYENEDGKRVCEIMVDRWFDSDMSDEELLNHLNNTPEGKKILEGLAFRIPTQKQNSIDVIRIAKFLPKEFGDCVVIPSAMVRKVGSDFDIDKLSVYLKNIYIDGRGNVKLVPFMGYVDSETAKERLGEMYDRGEFLTKAQMQELDRIIEEKKDLNNAGKLLKSILYTDFSEDEITRDFVKSLNKEGFRKKYINNLYKKSLENEYIQSSQNLVSHELNYNQLIKPNSADELKALSKKIVKQRGEEETDYTNVGNMMDRTFMSGLRHAFVSGKYAIGIAATSQTNHSLNQRSPIYIDLNKKDGLNNVDKFWLGDGQIKFVNKFNTIQLLDGRTVATLSMIKDANGKYISDNIGQFIDGYVDISKGPWIIDMGASPNVAGTFLFLTKLGVPIEDIAYFMNQPIIRDYLRSIENDGYTYLFMDSYVDDIKKSAKYNVDNEELSRVKAIPDSTKLFKTIGREKFTPIQKAEQQFMLDEFLKYAKMAEHLFLVQQGTNFDTASLNDQYLIYKKLRQLEKAQNTIISSPNDLLNNSYVGVLGKNIEYMRNALSTILKSDQLATRQVIENVLDKYTNLPDREFLKVAQKAVNDFYDWAVQLDQNRNERIKSLLLSENNGPKEIENFVKEVRQNPNHPLYNNFVIGNKGIIEIISPDKVGGVNNVSIKNKDNKVYDQDQIIYSFREIRDYLKAIGKGGLYKQLVGVSVLQSGLSTTKYSFTSLLPYEDFKGVYNEVISNLENRNDINLMDFHNLNVFQRNNWNNDDITPYEKAKTTGYDYLGNPIYNSNMNFSRNNPKIAEAIKKGEIPPLVKISERSKASNSDVIVYSWNVIPKGKTMQGMMKERDYSFIKKGLFRKVYSDEAKTKPITTTYTKKFEDGTEKTYISHVYQMINAWGDSFRANEFYNVAKPSVIDNGFIKVEDSKYTSTFTFGNEVFKEDRYTSPERPDAAVSKFFTEEQKKTVPLQEIKPKGKPAINDNNKISSGEVSDDVITPLFGVKKFEGNVALRDGNVYNTSEINANMLEKMGYKIYEIGKILKSIC